MNITIETVDHSQMRPNVDGADWYFEQEYFCETCGLAFIEQGTDVAEHYCSKMSCDHQKMAHREWLRVKIEPLSDPRYEMLLAVHELTEALMCRHNGVTQEAVDAFDTEYDKTHSTDCNAGDDPAAPYKIEHTFATAIERILAGVWKVDWETYDKELAATYPGPSHKK